MCGQGCNILFLFDVFKFDFYCSHITFLADVLVIYLFLFFICTITIIVAKLTTCYFHLTFFLIISNMVVIMYHSSRLRWCQGFAVKELNAQFFWNRHLMITADAVWCRTTGTTEKKPIVISTPSSPLMTKWNSSGTPERNPINWWQP